MPRPNRGPRLGDKPINGQWYIVWSDNGRSERRSTGTGDRREAAQVLAHFIIADRDAKARSAAPVIPTVAEVCAAYLEGHVADNDLAKTRKDQTEAMRHVIGSKLADVPATEITPDDVKRYGKARTAGEIGYKDPVTGKTRGYRCGGPAAFRNEMLYLNAALRWCVENRKFGGLTLATLHPVKVPPAPPPRKHYFTVAQADALLAAAKARSPNGFDPLYLFILIALDTAARKESIETLTWDRVTLARNEDGTWRGEVDLALPGRRVTKKRRGVNDLSPSTAAILADAREQARSEHVLGSDGTVSFRFRRLAKQVCGYETGPHILRHSWATWAIAGGVPPVDVADVLHDTLSTVMRVYRHAMPENRRAAVNFVAGLRTAANDAAPAPAAETGT